MRATTCSQGPTTRRRMSMGLDASMDPEEDRDPEGQVDDYDELIRCACRNPAAVLPLVSCLSCVPLIKD